MKLGIGNRYALWFSAVSLLILSAVLLTTIAVISRSSNILRERLREGTIENFEAAQQTMMFNFAEYLRGELFNPLYELDIERIDHSINDLRQGMPIISVCIADPSGKVLTDGTDENRSYGTQLQLDRNQLASTPIVIEQVEAGHRVTFHIGVREYTAGYGEIVFSEAPLKTIISRQDETMLQIWRDFMGTFFRIAVAGGLIIALITVFISVVFSRTLSAPLIALRDATGRLARGDLGYRVEVRSPDELGELAASFNQMAGDLQKRTTELAVSNAALQAEIEERKRKERDLEETQEKLQAAKEAAEAANWAKSEFLANMSHEMRTPLAGAMGMITLVLSMEIGEQPRQLLEMAKRSTDSLLRLISDLLDFSRLEAGSMAFEKKTFALSEAIETAVEVVSIHAREKGLHLTWEMDKGVPEKLTGDEGRLRQVLVNLLGNSVKFTKEGEVGVTVRPFHDPEAPDGNFLLFSVRDTGIGIPADQIERIFGKFTQVDASWTRRHGGAGLGLALSKQIVEKIGGRIWVESRLGEGSVFHFTYPLV